MQKRDSLKEELAASKGITLITVPFWWDGKKERFTHPQLKIKALHINDRPPLNSPLTNSLIATIQAAAPQLLTDVRISSPPIPATMPVDAEETPVHVEGVGEPTQACFFTLSKVDPKNWYVTTFLGTRQLQPVGGGRIEHKSEI